MRIAVDGTRNTEARIRLLEREPPTFDSLMELNRLRARVTPPRQPDITLEHLHLEHRVGRGSHNYLDLLELILQMWVFTARFGPQCARFTRPVTLPVARLRATRGLPGWLTPSRND